MRGMRKEVFKSLEKECDLAWGTLRQRDKCGEIEENTGMECE